MTTPTPIPEQNSQPAKPQEALPTLFNSISGAAISGGFAIALYLLTSSIAQTFARKPLVVGMSTLATTVFGVIALGLVLVSIVVLIQQLKNPKTPSA
jgi:hypothetical protein